MYHIKLREFASFIRFLNNMFVSTWNLRC